MDLDPIPRVIQRPRASNIGPMLGSGMGVILTVLIREHREAAQTGLARARSHSVQPV